MHTQRLALLGLLLLGCGEKEEGPDADNDQDSYDQGYQDGLAARSVVVDQLAADLASLQLQVAALADAGLASEDWVLDQGFASASVVDGLQTGLSALDAQVDDNSTRLDTVEASAVVHAELDVAAVGALLAVVEVDPAEHRLAFHDVNVFVQSGSGATDDDLLKTGELTGLGNLVIGYDEAGAAGKTGSHNLVIGPGHSYQGYGGIVGGQQNSIDGVGASVLGGTQNSAEGLYAVVVAGKNNTVSGDGSVIVAGDLNSATGHWSAILGGYSNTVAGFKSTISGGSDNLTGDWWHCSVLGGLYQQCTADHDTVY